MPNYNFVFIGDTPGEVGGQLLNNFDKIAAEVVTSGAEIARQHMQTHAPRSSFAPHARITEPYLTPSDGAMNSNAYLGGYRPFKGNRKTFARRNRRGGTMYISHEGVPVNFVTAQFYRGRKNGRRFPIRREFLDNIPLLRIEQAMQKKFDEFEPEDK